MPNIQHQLLSTTDSGKLVYQLGTDSPQQVSTTTGAVQTPHPRHRHYKRTEQNDLTLLTDRDWPITTNLRHLSLTGHNITAKLTNQFIQTGLRTFDWQQLFTWLWRWLPFWLSKRQSPLPTTVLLRTTPTPRIKLHYYMLPRVQTIYRRVDLVRNMFSFFVFGREIKPESFTVVVNLIGNVSKIFSSSWVYHRLDSLSFFTKFLHLQKG